MNGLTDTERKLAKAEHDRDRYAKRICFLQGRHAYIVRDYHALRLENRILRTAITALERVLMNESRTETCAEESAEKSAETSAVRETDEARAR